MSYENSHLMRQLKGRNQQLASCVKLLLLWIAASDGKFDEEEKKYLCSVFETDDQTISTSILMQMVSQLDLDSFELAIRALAAEAAELRTGFLDLAITMAVVDSRIAISENHILRFYADALNLGRSILEDRYVAITGYAIPMPGDPSSVAWWSEVTRKASERKKKNQQHESHYSSRGSGWRNSSGNGMSEEQARAVLGVRKDSSMKDIKSAYRSLAAIFHPDRVESMGSAATLLAAERFKMIQQAYRRLTK